MGRFDRPAYRQVRDGAGHLKDLVMGPGGEFQFFHGPDEDLFSLF